jgi:hypothetical protein
MPDNGSFTPKALLRSELRRELGSPTVLEGFTGEGRMYRAAWEGLRGATIDKDEAKVRDAARERPTWAVYQGDTERALRAGWMAHHPFEVIDLDAYGSPWPFVRAWFAPRARAPRTVLVLTDGYFGQVSMSHPCKVLFGADTTRRVLDLVAYREIVARRLAEWASPVRVRVSAFDTIRSRRVALHTVRLDCEAA